MLAKVSSPKEDYIAIEVESQRKPAEGFHPTDLLRGTWVSFYKKDSPEGRAIQDRQRSNRASGKSGRVIEFVPPKAAR